MKDLEEYLFGAGQTIKNEQAARLLFPDAYGVNDKKYPVGSLEYFAEYEQKNTGRGSFWNMSDMHSKGNMTKIKYVNRGYKLMINNVDGWCFINDDAIINYTDIKYTEKDIKLSKYRYGSHWYAKIDKIDVCIDGVSKWNTEEFARRNAVEFLKTLN